MSCFLFIWLHTTQTPIVWNPEFGYRGSLANKKTHCCVDRWIHNSSILRLSSIYLKPRVFGIQNTSTFMVKAQTYSMCTAVPDGSLITERFEH